MARKDQKKIFFIACISDDPFVKMMRTAKVPFPCWSYINAISKLRDKLQNIFYSQVVGDLQKQIKAAINKATDYFNSLSYNAYSLEHYISFVAGLCNDIYHEARNKTEKKLLSRIEQHLFSLYQKFDPDIEDNISIDRAIADLIRLKEYF